MCCICECVSASERVCVSEVSECVVFCEWCVCVCSAVCVSECECVCVVFVSVCWCVVSVLCVGL